MKKTKRMLAALMSAVMLGTFSVVPNMVYAETDTSVPFSVTIDNPDMTEGYFAVIFKNDYSKETIENTIIPELKSNDKIKDIRYYKTYYNADNFYTTDTSVYEAEYIQRDVYIVELASDDKETTYAVETAFSETEYFHYIDAVNFFKASAAQIPPDDESESFTAKLEDNFIANKLVVMFKGKYSKEELESTIIPELKEINSIRDFRYMSTGEKGRAMYIIDLDFEREDKESAYNTAKALYDTGYFYCVEMNMLPIAADINVDESEPFTAKLEDNFIANSVIVTFKSKYTKDEIENTIIPELKSINGIKTFKDMTSSYIVELNFEREDKESAYNTAKALYDTGYFYCVEMNMIPIMDSVAVNGDANCDGELSMADAVLIMQSLANPERFGVNGTDENHITEQGKKNADIAGDNDGITNADALAIQMKLLGLDNTADAEYEKTIDWYGGNLPSGVWELCRGNGNTAIITNADELKTYIEQVAPEESISSYIEKYNDSYFKDNVLLINSVNQSSGAAIGYEFDRVDISDNEINISIKSTLKWGEPAAAMVSLCIAQVSVPKISYNGQTVNWTKIESSPVVD